MVFPGLGRAATRAERLGASWESVSTPFLHFEDGRLVSHIGVIETPLVLLGTPTTVASLHAVATHPEYRRRGYYRLLIEEVFDYCRGRYNTLVLTTENPEYYEPFGFRVLPEHVLTSSFSASPGEDGFRRLNTEDPDDVRTLNRLLESRTPVSHVVGVAPEKAVFFFNEGGKPLHYCPELETVLCMEVDGSKLRLFDVVAPRLPSAEQILKRMPDDISEVELNFASDRMAPGAKAARRVLDHDGPSYLMVRGPFAAEKEAFTLPRSART
jgi:hypothetical protein